MKESTGWEEEQAKWCHESVLNPVQQQPGAPRTSLGLQEALTVKPPVPCARAGSSCLF